jgi:hypothetical protein
MKIMNKITLCMVIGLSSSALLVRADTSYPTLHDSSSASSAYTDFLNGGDDPFDSLGSGYSDAYFSEIESSISPSQLLSLEQKSYEQSASNEAFLEELYESKSTTKDDLYKGSFDQNGEFDPVAYAESYAELTSFNNETTEVYWESSRDSMVEIMSDNIEEVDALSDDVFSYISDATSNLIDELNSNSYNTKLNLASGFDDSVSATDTIISQIDPIIALAETFDSECGEACEIPDPVEEENEPECLSDSNNYISITEFENSDYGEYETEFYDEVYVYNGIDVYRYTNYTTDGEGSSEETDGSTSGFWKGDKDTSRSSGTVTIYEICTN